MDAINEFEIKIEEPVAENLSSISRPILNYPFNIDLPPFATRRMPYSRNGFIESQPPAGPLFNFLANNPVPQVILFPQNRHEETLTLPILRGTIAPEPLHVTYRPPETIQPPVSLLQVIK